MPSKKILLMGASGVGKTSMHSIIFANTLPKMTADIGYTVGKAEHNYKIFNMHEISLWDCGGNDTFMEEYLFTRAQNIFSKCEALVFVFDVSETDDQFNKKSLPKFKQVIVKLLCFSNDSDLFVLFNKADMLKGTEQQIAQTLKFRRQAIKELVNEKMSGENRIFITSIHDYSLFESWSEIIRVTFKKAFKVPLKEQLIDKLFETTPDCRQILLLEKKSLLVLCSRNSHNQNIVTGKSEESLACILKNFLLCLSSRKFRVSEIAIERGHFAIIIKEFGNSFYLLIVLDKAEAETVNHKTILDVNVRVLEKSWQLKQ